MERGFGERGGKLRVGMDEDGNEVISLAVVVCMDDGLANDRCPSDVIVHCR
jgi:hypothetical protein